MLFPYLNVTHLFYRHVYSLRYEKRSPNSKKENFTQIKLYLSLLFVCQSIDMKL